ncbi:MAG TPA: hypothetical protein VJQ44_06985 [Gemmatimonadales bacterium]|nr:hypothetical protein [Gemmatimonadales bacterium]
MTAPRVALRNAALLCLVAACGGDPAAPETGSLALAVSGLPNGTSADVHVTGPDGFARDVAASATLSGLTPGGYVVTASVVMSGTQAYAPSPISQNIAVTDHGPSDAAVAYAPAYSAGGFNLRVDGVYLVQSVQTYGNGIPLVRDRDALMRVFVTANQVNAAAPAVRVRLYRDGSLIRTSVINAPAAATPQTANEGDLAASWNLVIDKADVQPHLGVLVDVDPGNAVDEGDEGDNEFPANGVPLPVDVRNTDAFAVRFVPVVTSGDGRMGNVTTGNMAQFVSGAMRVHPLAAYDAVVAQPYTTNANTTLQNDAGSWGTILAEIEAARVDAGDGRAWFGVVNPDYSSGIAGMGYIGLPSAIGWDKLPSASGVAAHEWGHNWGRQHAPCGDPANPDQNFPYSGGVTGVFGYDQLHQVVKLPTMHDLMGYCSSEWISDYTYLGVLNYRAQHPLSAAVGQAAQSALLVWGRIERGRVILEPAFRVYTRPSLPQTSGPYRIEGRAADGSSLLRLDFAPAEVADAPDAPRSFAFAVPLSSDRADRLATLTLAGEGRTATVSAAPQAAAVDVRSGAAGRVHLRWDAGRAPVVLVRDPGTGQVIAFARGGQADVVTSRSQLSLSVGDRVGGRDLRVTLPGR